MTNTQKGITQEQLRVLNCLDHRKFAVLMFTGMGMGSSAVYGECPYIMEKHEYRCRNLLGFICDLDPHNFDNLVDALQEILDLRQKAREVIQVTTP